MLYGDFYANQADVSGVEEKNKFHGYKVKLNLALSELTESVSLHNMILALEDV